MRAGHVKEVFPVTFPSVLGWDISGTVEEAGDKVTQFKRGDEVYALVKGGGYAPDVFWPRGTVFKVEDVPRKKPKFLIRNSPPPKE